MNKHFVMIHFSEVEVKTRFVWLTEDEGDLHDNCKLKKL